MTTGKKYIILTATPRIKEQVSVVFYHSYVSIYLLRLGDCKQWLEYQQCCANQSFIIDVLGDLETISLIYVYKVLIYASIQ
jgi:hypothetical protein